MFSASASRVPKGLSSLSSRRASKLCAREFVAIDASSRSLPMLRQALFSAVKVESATIDKVIPVAYPGLVSHDDNLTVSTASSQTCESSVVVKAERKLDEYSTVVLTSPGLITTSSLRQYRTASKRQTNGGRSGEGGRVGADVGAVHARSVLLRVDLKLRQQNRDGGLTGLKVARGPLMPPSAQEVPEVRSLMLREAPPRVHDGPRAKRAQSQRSQPNHLRSTRARRLLAKPTCSKLRKRRCAGP
eukprot:scaffold5522_cov334-Pinguiococcus_pyrenoidosus.AAC.5